MLGGIGDGLLVIRSNRLLTGVFTLAVVPTMFLMPAMRFPSLRGVGTNDVRTSADVQRV